ncbi:Uncharacterised protein [Serratia fonticola]|nr:Uncharacterised protein [Serratia fonticola]CAI1015584.1 Uncharacterised protein [Serratia fonticola]
MTLTVFLCLRFAVIDGDMQLFFGVTSSIFAPHPNPLPQGEGASTALWLGFGGDL